VAEKFLQNETKIYNHIINYYEVLGMQTSQLMARYINFSHDAKCLFVGCGALPMTAIKLSSTDLKYNYYLLDRSSKASTLADKVIQKLKLNDKITVLPSQPLENFTRLDAYQSIVIAAMVGQSQEEKVKIYFQLAESLPPGKIIFARGIRTDSFKCLVYSLFPLEKLTDKYRLLDYLDGGKNSIVSTLVLERI